MRFYILIMLMCCSLIACESIAVLSTPQKKAITAKDPWTNKAERFFWDTLHQGRYSDIDESVRLLMIAYLKNPNDPHLAAHLGFMHTWKITERDRKKPNPLMPDQIILAKKYFQDAATLMPKNPIYQGFLGDTQLVEGQIFKDKREQVRGYYQLQRAIAQWPQFNYFTAGYPMSTLAAHTALFKEALEWQWQTLNLCAGEKINRKQPDFSPYMAKETQSGPQRACWNSWIAPFNFEGFFLNMGDMLVKAGDWQTAILIYKNAKLDKHYHQWPFRHVLEERIAKAKENTSQFQDEDKARTTILFNSGIGCQVCHRKAML